MCVRPKGTEVGTERQTRAVRRFFFGDQLPNSGRYKADPLPRQRKILYLGYFDF